MPTPKLATWGPEPWEQPVAPDQVGGARSGCRALSAPGPADGRRQTVQILMRSHAHPACEETKRRRDAQSRRERRQYEAYDPRRWGGVVPYKADEVQISHQYFPYKAVTERAAASSEETHELRWRSAEVVGVPASRPCNLYRN